jgi:hypothetical protein
MAGKILVTGPAEPAALGKLPAVPTVRALTRRAAVLPVIAAAVAAGAALAGCSQVNNALGRQWAVVNFKPDTTVATVAKVRAACAHVPHLVPLPASAVSGDIDIRYAVRYEVRHASGSDFAALKACLQRFPEVSGVSIDDVATGS